MPFIETRTFKNLLTIKAILLIRRGKMLYWDRYKEHLELYDELSGKSFTDLYHRIMSNVYVALYFFCILNAGVERKGK